MTEDVRVLLLLLVTPPSGIIRKRFLRQHQTEGQRVQIAV